MRTTDRDAEIVAWLGRIGAAGAEHVRERFGIGHALSYKRLAELTADGLLEHRMVLHGRPGMYSATRRGLRAHGLARLPAFQVSPGQFEHTWQMASAAVALHRELPGWQLLAEREIGIWQAEHKQVLAWAKVGVVGARSAYHRPDFVLISPAGRIVVVEVELTPKDASRLRRICRAWTRARHVEHVYYLATEHAGRAVGRAVEAVKGADLIAVLGLTDVPRLAELELQTAAASQGGEQAPQGSGTPNREASDAPAA